MPQHPILFSPVRVGRRWLKNRLVGLPIYTGYAHPGGRVSALMISHYRRLAGSGAALVVVANAAVSVQGILSEHNLRIDRDEFIPGLTKLARVIKAGGALACIQLNHAGRFAKTEQPLLPSALDSSHLAFHISSLKDFMNYFPLEKRFGLTRRLLKAAGHWTRAMTVTERQRTVGEFGAAASRAWAAGFDMVEIHGAGGYLLCQFLSPFTHKFRDDFSGTFRDRAVFPLSILREIKRCVPAHFPIGYRLILKEWVPGGIDLDEALSFGRLLEKEGVAYLSASAATYNSMLAPAIQRKMAHPGYLQKEVAALSQSVRVPTIISGRIIDPAMADRFVRTGVAQLIGLGRTLRVNPQWISQAAFGQTKGAACYNCNGCIKRVVLDEGFNCRRWTRQRQEKTDLEIKLLRRNYKSLFVATGAEDLDLIQSILPHLLPDEKGLRIGFSPTFLFFKSRRGEEDLQGRADACLAAVQTALGEAGLLAVDIKKIVIEAPSALDHAVYRQVQQGHHGLVVIPTCNKETWRKRVVGRCKRKIVVCIGTHAKCSRLLIPVDMSLSTLLTLMFFQQTFMGKAGIQVQYVHISTANDRAMADKWLKIKTLIRLEDNPPLRIMPVQTSVTTDLVALIHEENFDAVLMGRRGVTRMKRWLMGSVSAGVLRAIQTQTLFLID